MKKSERKAFLRGAEDAWKNGGQLAEGLVIQVEHPSGDFVGCLDRIDTSEIRVTCFDSDGRIVRRSSDRSLCVITIPDFGLVDKAGLAAHLLMEGNLNEQLIDQYVRIVLAKGNFYFALKALAWVEDASIARSILRRLGPKRLVRALKLPRMWDYLVPEFLRDLCERHFTLGSQFAIPARFEQEWALGRITDPLVLVRDVVLGMRRNGRTIADFRASLGRVAGRVAGRITSMHETSRALGWINENPSRAKFYRHHAAVLSDLLAVMRSMPAPDGAHRDETG